MKSLALSLFAFLLIPLHADPIEGAWRKDDGQATIRLSVENGKLTGKVIEVAEDSKVRDFNNPDPSLRTRKIIGLPIVKGFWKEDNQWTGGTVYDPSKGKTYKGTIWLENESTLKMRGFIGVSAIGRTATWTRLP